MVDLVIPIIFAGFPVFAMAAGFIFAAFGGWQLLAKTYPMSGKFDGQLHVLKSFTINGIQYRWIVNIGVSRSGLHLSAIFPMWPSHQAIPIPWSDLEVKERGRTTLTGVTEFTFSKRPNVKVQVNALLGNKLEKEAGALWPTTQMPTWYSPPSEPYAR